MGQVTKMLEFQPGPASVVVRSTFPEEIPDSHFALRGLALASTPGFRGEASRKLKHLHHGSGREDMDHGARCRFDFCRGFAHCDAGYPLDFALKRGEGTSEQLAMKFSHVRCPLRRATQGLFGWREGLVQRDDQGPFAENNRH